MKTRQRFAPVVISYLLLAPFAQAQSDRSAAQRLREQGEHFQEQVVRVADGVYTAVGYSVSNSSMIVGADGVVIIDTGMTRDAADRIYAEFRRISDKPVKAIVFTHGHGDHTGGAAAFLSDQRPQVWAHQNFGSESRPLLAGGVAIQRQRGARQAGFTLKPEQRINNGIAPVRYPKRGGEAFGSGSLRPTHFLEEERLTIRVAGIDLDLVSSPGETNDSLYVYYPKQRVLFAGDNFYRSFPNLYAIRGTPQRSVRVWADTLTKLASEDAGALVGGHTDPIVGQERVKEVLTNYRDAVRFIHDKTVEGMNLGMTPDQLVAYARLPDHLAKQDYLQPFYGHPEWGVRSVFNGYLGWYDGNPTNLFPLDPAGEAERVARLAGGSESLLQAAQAAVEADDPQWSAQLSDYLLALDPADPKAREVKATALTLLAEKTLNATARNYYLSVARELRQSRD